MKKIHAVRLRVSDEELTQLQASAKQLGVTSSALLRLHMNNGLSGNCARAARMEARLEGVSLGVYAAMLNSYGAGGVGLYPHHVHWDVGRPAVFWDEFKR